MAREKAGFILLHRSITDNWIWEDPIKLKWWLTILLEVNHTKHRVNIGFELITCDRGQSLNSLETWSKIFRVDVSTVRRFFKLLQADHMIKTENIKKTTRLTVVNYENYQEKINYDQFRTKKRQGLEANSQYVTEKVDIQSNSEAIQKQFTNNTNKEYIKEDIKKDERMNDIENEFFRLFRNHTNQYEDDFLIMQVKSLVERYPDAMPFKSGRLVGTWVTNIRESDYKAWKKQKESFDNATLLINRTEDTDKW